MAGVRAKVHCPHNQIEIRIQVARVGAAGFAAVVPRNHQGLGLVPDLGVDCDHAPVRSLGFGRMVDPDLDHDFVHIVVPDPGPDFVHIAGQGLGSDHTAARGLEFVRIVVQDFDSGHTVDHSFVVLDSGHIAVPDFAVHGPAVLALVALALADHGFVVLDSGHIVGVVVKRNSWFGWEEQYDYYCWYRNRQTGH